MIEHDLEWNVIKLGPLLEAVNRLMYTAYERKSRDLSLSSVFELMIEETSEPFKSTEHKLKLMYGKPLGYLLNQV